MKKIRIPELELRILTVLWKTGSPLTVQDVIERWPGEEKPGYTTVLKKLQVMEEKRFVAHEKEGKLYRYSPLVSREDVTKSRMQELLSELFQGDRLMMMNAFLDETDLTPEEIDAMKRKIDSLERDR